MNQNQLNNEQGRKEKSEIGAQNPFQGVFPKTTTAHNFPLTSPNSTLGLSLQNVEHWETLNFQASKDALNIKCVEGMSASLQSSCCALLKP